MRSNNRIVHVPRCRPCQSIAAMMEYPPPPAYRRRRTRTKKGHARSGPLAHSSVRARLTSRDRSGWDSLERPLERASNQGLQAKVWPMEWAASEPAPQLTQETRKVGRIQLLTEFSKCRQLTRPPKWAKTTLFRGNAADTDNTVAYRLFTRLIPRRPRRLLPIDTFRMCARRERNWRFFPPYCRRYYFSRSKYRVVKKSSGTDWPASKSSNANSVRWPV